MPAQKLEVFESSFTRLTADSFKASSFFFSLSPTSVQSDKKALVSILWRSKKLNPCTLLPLWVNSHPSSLKLFHACLKGLPYASQRLNYGSNNPFHTLLAMCWVISWGNPCSGIERSCSFTPQWSFEMTEGRAASRVASQETLPPDWGMEILSYFAGKHCWHVYVIYNHEKMHYQAIGDVSELSRSLQLLTCSSVSAGLRIDCYGSTGKHTSGILLFQGVCPSMLNVGWKRPWGTGV